MTDAGHKPKRTLTTEFWVGIFFIAGLFGFSYLTQDLAGMSFSDAGFYAIKAEFDNVSGLENGATVEIAGVQVGKVKDISLDGTSAIITMEIREGIKFRDDDIAAVRTKGIIGDRFVKIIPGGSEDIVPPGGRISDTESVVEFEEIIGKFIHSME